MSRSAVFLKLLAIALVGLFTTSCDAARPLSHGTVTNRATGMLRAARRVEDLAAKTYAAAAEKAKKVAGGDDVVDTAAMTTAAFAENIAAADAVDQPQQQQQHARRLQNWFGGSGGGSSDGGAADAEEESGGDGGEEGGAVGEDGEGGAVGEGGEGGADEGVAGEDAGAEDGSSGEGGGESSEEGGSGSASKEGEEDGDASNGGGGGGGDSPSTEFESHDHTDLYTVKRDRDRAWEQAKKGGSRGGGDAGAGTGVKIHKTAAATRRGISTGKTVEYGQWIQLGDNYAFVSKNSGGDGTYTTTAADDNLRAALGISKDSTDSEMLMKSLDQRKWQHASDHIYREKVCRGSKHDMPRWCKGPSGPGGRLAHDLDEAEQAWQEAAAKRQEAKMSLLGAHKAYLKEAAIQKEAMEYTKKALEAQEAVDAAAKMAATREHSENDLLQQMEVAEQNNWRALVSVRHTIIKYRTMSKEQVEEMEREEAIVRRQKERDDRIKTVGERNKVAGEARAQADAVDRAKQKAKKAQEELKAALVAAAKIEAQANRVQGVGAATSSVDAGDQEAAGGGDEKK